MVAGITVVSILQVSDWARVSVSARHYFSVYIITSDKYQDSMQQANLGLSQ